MDFTSAPKGRKAITVATCRLDGATLRFDRIERLTSLAAFEAALSTPGAWVAGLDFPFTQPRKLLRNLGWPEPWPNHADHLSAMTWAAFVAALLDYKARRPAGDKEHPRGFEVGTGAASPMKLSGVPVGLMHHAGVPPLRRSGAHVPGLVDGDRSRIVLEAYPGVAARGLIGAKPYKTDEAAKNTPGRLDARRAILAALTGEAGRDRFGLVVDAPPTLADDPSGDDLDALLCAVQAAWGLRLLARGGLDGLDLSEGWIADPAILPRLAPLA